MPKYIVSIIAIVLMTSGCATITRGTSEVFIVNTAPVGAEIAISNGETCVSPCSLIMKRKNGFHVSIVKNDYHTVEASINTQVTGAGSAGMAGNVLLGGVIGVGVDATSGAMNKFVPNPLEVTLVLLKENEVADEPIVKQGESFHYKTYKETKEKLPFDKKERKQEKDKITTRFRSIQPAVVSTI